MSDIFGDDPMAIMINDLYPLVEATEATEGILSTCKKTFDKLQVFICEANEKINNMNVELVKMQKDFVDFQNEYFPKFNNAKSDVRKIRQTLGQLAHRTTTETRDLKVLLEALDESEDTFLLKAAIEKMKDLMVLSKDALIQASEKYNKAIETFENINSSIQTLNSFLKKLLDTESEEYKSWTAKVRGVTYSTTVPTFAAAFAVGDVLGGNGLCSAIGNLIVISTTVATIEGIIYSYTAQLKKFEVLTAGIVASSREIDENLKEGIAFLSEEICVLNKWSNNVDTVSKNIDKYPQEFLKKYMAIRTIFINGLNDLQTTASDFLNRGEFQ